MGEMLFIEYDVDDDGMIELVALINAVEENGEDPEGAAWLAWRSAMEDEGMGCVGVEEADLRTMEETQDPEELSRIVERIVLADRAVKEAAR
ncbi:MAG: hypothetical protein ACLP62_12060 [Acidimicrobiales bacterium]